jgi:hypothetical protein
MFRLFDYINFEPRDARELVFYDDLGSLQAPLLIVATLFAFQLSVAVVGFLSWLQD